MPRIAKIAAIVLGVFILVVVLAVVAAALLFDPNDYKALAEKTVQEKTGRKFTISGDISPTFFPWLGVSLPKMELANAPGFGDKPFASMDKAVVRVKLWPLLHKKVEAGRILVDGLSLSAMKNKEGKSNWEDLVKAGSETGGEAAGEEQKGGGISDIRLEGLSIKDASVSYSDEQQGQDIALSKVNLTTTEIAPGKPSDIELSFSLSSTKPELAADGKVTGTLSQDLEKKSVTFQKAVMEITAKGGAIPGKTLTAKASGDFSVVAQDFAADLGSFSATLRSVDVNGKLSAKGNKDALTFNGSVNVPRASLPGLFSDLNKPLPKALAAVSQASLFAEFSGDRNNADVKSFSATVGAVSAKGSAKVANLQGNQAFSGSFSLPVQEAGKIFALLGDMAPKPLGTPIAKLGLSTDFSGDKNNAQIKNLVFTLDNETIAANLAVKDIKGAMAFSGNASSAGLPLRALMATAGVKAPETSDPQVLSRLGFSADFAGDKNNVSVKNLIAKLDDTTAKGSAEVANLKKPAIAFSLAVDSLNADRYLPAEKKGKKEEAKGAGEAGGGTKTTGSEKIPTEPLRKINAKGDLTIGKLVLKKLSLSDVKVAFSAKDGLIDLSRAQADLYGGRASLPAKVDARTAELMLSAAPSLAGISFGPLLADFIGKQPLTGTGGFSANFSTKGETADALTRMLNGDIKLSVENGTVEGLNVANKVRDAWAVVQGKSIAAQAKEATEFVALTATAKITDGLLSNNDLSLASPAMKITGKGTANLFEKTVDYVITANLDKGFTGLGSVSGVDLANIPVPIRIKGGFGGLSFSADTQGLANALVQAKGNELKQKLEKQLPGNLKNALPGLFGAESEKKTDTTTQQTTEQAPAGEQQKPKPADLLRNLFK
ncbi:MAG: AsmA family protein [Thermodesulfobacteriota bacterium]